MRDSFAFFFIILFVECTFGGMLLTVVPDEDRYVMIIMMCILPIIILWPAYQRKKGTVDIEKNNKILRFAGLIATIVAILKMLSRL